MTLRLGPSILKSVYSRLISKFTDMQPPILFIRTIKRSIPLTSSGCSPASKAPAIISSSPLTYQPGNINANRPQVNRPNDTGLKGFNIPNLDIKVESNVISSPQGCMQESKSWAIS